MSIVLTVILTAVLAFIGGIVVDRLVLKKIFG